RSFAAGSEYVSVPAAGFGASATASSAAGNATGDAIQENPVVNVSTSTRSSPPLILPGLLTAAQAEVALPMNRIYFSYGYFDGFRVGPTTTTTTTTVNPSTILLANNDVRALAVQGVTPGTTTRITPGGDGFNLNTYTVGLEKTLFDGR